MNILSILEHDIIGISVVAFAILLLFVTSEYLYRVHQIESEKTRKLVHFGSGVITLSFPWIFSSIVTIIALAVAFIIILFIGKMTGWLSGVHNVSRTTGGAYYYPLTIILTFWLAEGNPLLFCIPISILALSDAVAALVGKKFGRHKYAVLEGYRSIEGSLAFLLITMMLNFLGLCILSDFTALDILYISIVVGLFTTTIEGSCILGLDNLLIPYGVFLVLQNFVTHGMERMGNWVEGIGMSVLLVVGTWSVMGLTEAGALGMFITGTIAWSLGGWLWSAPLLSLLLLSVLLTPMRLKQNNQQPKTDLDDILPTTLGAIMWILLYQHSNNIDLFLPYITAISTGGAIAFSRLGHSSNNPRIPLAILGSIFPIVPLLFAKMELSYMQIIASALFGLLCFYLLRNSKFPGRRLVATLFASTISWALAYL